MRLVAADASTIPLGLRASGVKRAALCDQIGFGVSLSGSELMLAASLLIARDSGRQILLEHLDRLGTGDLLLLDRGYPWTLTSARSPLLIIKPVPGQVEPNVR